MNPSDAGMRGGVMVRRLALYAAALIATFSLVLADRLPGAGASAATLHATLQPKSIRVASVRAIKRGLAVQPPHQKAGKGKVKQPLYGNYGLATAAGQKASVAFVDGSLLHINQRTDLLLRSPTLTVVRKGEVDQITTPGSNHLVQTASAVASAIGTNFDLRILHGNVTGIVVVEGAVLVKNAAGSVVVETGQQTTVAKGEAPAPPTPADPAAQVAWTRQLPSPSAKVGQNVALNANGGGVVGFSSQRESAGGTWDAANIIDGRLDRGWASGPVSGSASTREWVKIALDSASAQAVSEVIVDPAATGSLDTNTDLKDFEIWVSTTGTDDANFTLAASGTALQQNALQRFVLPSPVRARYVELVARTNYGSTVAISVAEIEIVGARAPVVTPAPTAASTSTLTPTAASIATPTVVPSPSATPTPTATQLPDIILGSLAIYAATGPLASGGATCSAPGEVQTTTIHALDPYMYVKQTITRWQGTHTWRVDWLTPSGTLIVSSGDQSQTDSTSSLCWYLALGGEPTLSMAGTWTVKVYLDDSLAASGSYTMVDNRTTPAGSLVISQSTIWREPTTLPPPHATTCTFPGEQQSSVILTTDVAELTKHEVSSWSGTHTLWGEWYRPNGTLYDWLPFTGTDEGTSEWCFYDSVAGGGIGSVPGNWRFKVYIDSTPAGDLPFTVQSAAARSQAETGVHKLRHSASGGWAA